MKYTFYIAKSSSAAQDLEQGARAYYQEVALRAQLLARLSPNNLSVSEAFELCEYLDLVDARELGLNKSLYLPCTNLLYAYLSAYATLAERRLLGGKSWAAQSLLEVIQATPVSTYLNDTLGRKLG